MTLHCKNCNQTVLPTDTVCWHCGWELAPTPVGNDAPETGESTTPESDRPISITAVSIFALITLATILLFIIVTNALAHYSLG